MKRFFGNLVILMLLGMKISHAQNSAFNFIPSSASTLEMGANFWQATNLIEVRQGSELTQVVRVSGDVSYESATGSAINLSDWYKPKSQWVNSQVMFMSQVNDNFGLLWGVGTGEYGTKYTIEPSIKLGFVYRVPVTSSGQFYLRASTIIGGRLKEKSCIADFGQIGVHEVNCRLAAGIDAPEETLKYLMNQKPYNQNIISVVYRVLF